MRTLSRVLVVGVVAPFRASVTVALSSRNSNDRDAGANLSFALFDRFRAVCPADQSCIERFDPSLLSSAESGHAEEGLDGNKDGGGAAVWAAVYRSSNNKPSVMIRDEFLQAMRSATNDAAVPAPDSMTTGEGAVIETSKPVPSGTGFGAAGAKDEAKNKPVAVARLAPSPIFEGRYVLDQMRCVLRKEETDVSCDGGSEHNEAISTAIDALLEYYLSNNPNDRFDGVIRMKATLFSGKLLEERGFEPVDRLDADMATHLSSLDACMNRFAARAVDDDEAAKNPGARQRSRNIVSLLGRLDRERDLKVGRQERESDNDDSDTTEYDPWAGAKRFL